MIGPMGAGQIERLEWLARDVINFSLDALPS